MCVRWLVPDLVGMVLAGGAFRGDNCDTFCPIVWMNCPFGYLLAKTVDSRSSLIKSKASLFDLSRPVMKRSWVLRLLNDETTSIRKPFILHPSSGAQIGQELHHSSHRLIDSSWG